MMREDKEARIHRNDLVDIECTLHVETEKAIFVSDDGEKDNACFQDP